MKKFTNMLLLAFTLFLFLGPTTANALIISDTYWGADPTHGADRDVVGDAPLFDISRMEVSFKADGMYVDIYTRYLDNIGACYTQLGDLFISTDGWDPAGSGPHYVEDNADNSDAEDWEYVLVLSDRDGGSQFGDAFLYALGHNPVLSGAPSGYAYRKGQEVRYEAGSSEVRAATGSWSINNLGGSDDDDFLSFFVDFAGFDGISEFGFHWTMSCANDVIEGGAAPVPEPATMLLFGTGLIGLSVTGRKKFRRS